MLFVGAVAGALVTSAIAAGTMRILFARAVEVYAQFPSLKPPAVLRIGETITGFLFQWPVLLPLILVGAGTLLVAGAVTVLLVRPKSAWGDLASGLATAVAGGLTSFALGIGSAFVLGSIVVPTIHDRMLMVEATQIPKPDANETLVYKTRDPHPSDVLAVRYPDLKDVEPNKRGGYLFAKVTADMIAGSFFAIWAGLGFSLGLATCFAVPQTLAAGYLLRTRQRIRSSLLAYFEMSVSVSLLAFVPFGGLWMAMALSYDPNEVFETRQFLLAAATLGLLSSLALVGNTHGWRWPFRLVVYFVWLVAIVRIEGQTAPSSFWYVEVAAYASLAVLLVHYYDMQRQREQLATPVPVS
jgi:hypothetical protein